METQIIRVRGMYCTGCEGRIRKRLNSLPGVSACRADWERETVEVTYDPARVTPEVLRGHIEDLGYEVAADRGRYIQIASILVILLALYLIAEHLGLLTVFNLFPVIETGMGYGAIFLIGLLTSVHCIAMCGGIDLGQSTIAAKTSASLIRSNLLYNLGRVISYTLIGALAGGVGSVLSLGGRLRGTVAILAGAAMLLMALQMLGVFKPLRRLKLRLPDGLYTAGARLFKGRSSFLIGLLNGLMPCGPLQSMQIYALSSGSALRGAVAMLLFSLGTVPLMFGFGLFSGKLNRRHMKYMLTVSALVIFVMGLGMVGNGLSLSGVGLPTRSGPSSIAVLRGGEQTVLSQVDYGSYEPITVKAGFPVTWTIHVPEGRLNGCNNEIVVPAYGLDLKLSEGDNTLTFTPTEPGAVPYSCWMGMIKSSITVVE